MQAKSVVRENALEDAALTFPALEGTVFLPGTVYGKAVRNSLTGKYEMGFCFLSGITEFHMYSTDTKRKGIQPRLIRWLPACQLVWTSMY
jgi:hypothetical protein